jgi:DNA-binding winged helix-turn-helix (wHTH) protein
MRTSFGEFVLDQDGREVLRGGAPVHLTPKAYALLTYLASRPGRAVSKAELLEHLWPDVFVTEAALTTVVKELRHALGDSALEPHYVRGIRGFGYAFSAEPCPVPEPVPERPPAAGEHEYRIVWMDREIALAPGPNLLGRTHEAAVWVEDASVSRHHAILRVDGERVTVEDCGSKNGTFVDGERVDGARRVEPGDKIWLGHACLQLVHYVADQTTRSGG